MISWDAITSPSRFMIPYTVYIIPYTVPPEIETRFRKGVRRVEQAIFPNKCVSGTQLSLHASIHLRQHQLLKKQSFSFASTDKRTVVACFNTK